MGTNQFLQQLGYTCLIGFISENRSVWPGVCSVAIFSVCAALLVRLDLYVSGSLGIGHDGLEMDLDRLKTGLDHLKSHQKSPITSSKQAS